MKRMKVGGMMSLTQLTRIGRGLMLAGLGAHAAAWSQEVQKIERVEVTGSSIKRIRDEGALPIQVITRADMQKSGITTAEQLISDLNANGNGMDNLASNADVAAGSQRGNNGASAANLRGQGASSTLVLLNGRRIAAHGLNGGAVDLNQIPFAAVERVEILKDGASAIYGTDAIGGVINFILRRDFSGLTLNSTVDITQEGGGNIQRHALTGGWGNLDTDRFNVLGTLTFSDSKALRGEQRGFVNTFQPQRGLSVDTRGTPTSTVFPVGDTILSGLSGMGTGGINVLDLPGGAGCATMAGGGAYDEVLWQIPNARYACAWDTGRAAVLQQPVKNTNLVARGTFKLNDNHSIIGEFIRGRSESNKSFSPIQLSSSASATSDAFQAYYPSTGAAYDGVFNAIAAQFPQIAANYGKPIAFRWRCMACGNREVATTSDTGRALIGLEGSFGLWDYKAGYSQAFSESDSQLGGGYYYTQGLMNLIKTGVLNPFVMPGQEQTPEALAALAQQSAAGVTLYGGKFKLKQLDASTTGPLFKLPAGEVMGAVGIDLRRESFIFNGDERVDPRGIFLAPFDNTNLLTNEVTRDVKAVYGEVLVPIVKHLELSAAVRRDHYTGFGSSTNPKVSLRWQPVESVVMRGSYGTGFRVPTFNQVFFGITESTYSGKDLADPGRCPSGVVDPATPGCESITPVVLTGGKSDLGPEESKQFSAGFVWQPNANFIANVDWWSIKRNGTIQSLTLDQLTDNVALFGDRFIRDATGALVAIDQRPINAGETVTRGLDVGVRFSTRIEDHLVSAGMDMSYLLHKKSRLVASQPFGASEVGVFTRSGDLGLRWKHTAFVTLGKGDWSATVTQVYRSGYKDYVLPGVANGAVKPAEWNAKVQPYVLHHVSVAYRGFKNLTLTGAVKNIFNEDPPFTAAYDSNTGAGSSWEPRVADPRGRSFMLALEYKFF